MHDSRKYSPLSHVGFVESLESRTLMSAIPGVPNVVNISRAPGQQSEGAIAVNPRNPLQMFAASNQDGVSLFDAVSNDGGKTWSTGLVATGTDTLPRACCDPSATFDQFGNLFLGYLGEDSNNAELLLSIDGGKTFRHIASLPANADQPTVAVGHGTVWVAFQTEPQQMPPGRDDRARPASNAGAVAYAARVNGLGDVKRFGKPQTLAGPAGTNVGDIAVGPGGQVVVAYQDPIAVGASTIFIRRDPGGYGKKFLPAVAIGQTNVGDFEPVTPQARRTIDAEIGLTYDTSGGPFAGRLYMVYTDEPAPGSNNTDIYARFSDDDGVTWSDPQKVNDDATANAQFLPRIAVDPTTGAVGITWHDARNDTGLPPGGSDNFPNNETQFYGALGTPTAAGIDFSPNFPVTTGFSNTGLSANPNDYGDYTGLAFDAGVLTPVWADNSDSTGDNPNGARSMLDLYTAQVPVTLSTPAPTRSLLAQFGDIGGKVTIANAGGVPITLTLTHGVGFAFANGNAIDLVLQGTTAKSSLTLKSPGLFTLGNVQVKGSLKTLIGKTADLTGTLSARGTLGTITLSSAIGGTVAAAGAITSFSAGGLVNARILSGADLGPDGQIGGGDDAYSPGSLGSLKISASVTNSFIAAGFAPGDGLFDTPQGQLLGGTQSLIRSIVIRKGADATTHFAAGAFKIVKLPAKTDPAGDGRFTV